MFKSKVKPTKKTSAVGNIKDGKVAVPLKYFSNFWRTLHKSLINFEINVILTWWSTYVINNSTGVGTFAITNTKLYVSVVTLSIQDNPPPEEAKETFLNFSQGTVREL